jgi:hypothetical protein
LRQTLAVNRSKIETEGKELKGDLLKNRFRSPRRSKRSGDQNDKTQRLERFAPIVRWVTARVVFHNFFTPVKNVFSNL